jgi:hypothetical protein
MLQDQQTVWWQLHAAVLLKSTVYLEVAAQIVFMAWPQRVVNGGGIIDREYGIGREQICGECVLSTAQDLLNPFPPGQSRHPICNFFSERIAR